MSTTVSDPLFTRPQAAEYLGIKPQTLAVWASTRRYPLSFLKIGRVVRYEKSALDEFKRSCEVPQRCEDAIEAELARRFRL